MILNLYKTKTEAIFWCCLAVSHVTPTGLTVHFTQYDKRDCGELIYGKGYHLEVLNGDM